MTLEIDHLLGEKEVAKLLSVSNALLQRWRCYGGGPAYLRIGSRSIRYRKQDIIVFLDQASRASMARDDRRQLK